MTGDRELTDSCRLHTAVPRPGEAPEGLERALVDGILGTLARPEAVIEDIVYGERFVALTAGGNPVRRPAGGTYRTRLLPEGAKPAATRAPPGRRHVPYAPSAGRRQTGGYPGAARQAARTVRAFCRKASNRTRRLAPVKGK